MSMQTGRAEIGGGAPAAKQRKVRTALVPTLVLAITGCGGGGSAGPGAAPPPPPSVASPPIGRAAVQFGPCMVCDDGLPGFTLQIDGRPETIAPWHATGTLRGVAGAAGTFTWNSFEGSSVVVGAVEWTDVERSRFGVLGQEVHAFGPWVASGWNSPGSSPTGEIAITALRVGDRVRVYGDAFRGVVLGLAAQFAPAGAPDRVIGEVATLDPTTRTLRIGGLAVDYSGANLVGFPASGPQAGMYVEASGTASGSGALTATDLRSREGTTQVDDNADVAVSGLVSRRGPTTAAGVTELRVSGETLRVNASCFGVVEGSLLRFIGEKFADGTIHLDAGWQCRPDPQMFDVGPRIVGVVEAVDVPRSSLTLGGVQVHAQFVTQVGNGTDPVHPFAAVAVGDIVQIDGTPGSVAGHLVAARVIAEDYALPGTLDVLASMTGSGMTLQFLGLPVTIDAGTDTRLRSCFRETLDVTSPIAPASFIPTAFERLSVRTVRARLEASAGGGWHAIYADAYDYIYCD